MPSAREDENPHIGTAQSTKGYKGDRTPLGTVGQSNVFQELSPPVHRSTFRYLVVEHTSEGGPIINLLRITLALRVLERKMKGNNLFFGDITATVLSISATFEGWRWS